MKRRRMLEFFSSLFILSESQLLEFLDPATYKATCTPECPDCGQINSLSLFKST